MRLYVLYFVPKLFLINKENNGEAWYSLILPCAIDSEPGVILNLLLIFEILSLDDLIKIVLIEKVLSSTYVRMHDNCTGFWSSYYDYVTNAHLLVKQVVWKLAGCFSNRSEG